MKQRLSFSSLGRGARVAVLVAVALAAVAAFFAFRGENAAPDAQQQMGGRGAPAAPVLADKAFLGEFPVYFQGLGTVTPMNTVTVRSRVDGELVRLHFTEGETVKAGDLLAEIDPRPYQAELTQAEGQLLRDQALLRNARQDLARYKVLLPQDSATPQQVDAQQALVRQYEAAVKMDQGKIDAVRLQLSYCRIAAPIGGRLGLRLVDQGNMVRASDSARIVVITEVQPISVLFTVTESQIARVLAGMRGKDKLAVEAWDRTRTTLLATGELLTADNRIDTATGTVKLRASFDNADGMLFPNQFVNAKILVETLRDVVIAPTAAVQHASRGAFVFAVENGAAKLRDVVVSESNDTFAVIASGVAPGDVLITDGLDRLRDGSKVVPTLPGKRKASGNAPENAAPKDGADASGTAQGGKKARDAKP